jgi:hypothetical protein
VNEEQWKQVCDSLQAMETIDLQLMCINAIFCLSNRCQANYMILETPVQEIIYISIKTQEEQDGEIENYVNPK